MSRSEDYVKAFVSEPTVVLTGTPVQQQRQVQAAQNRVQKQASQRNAVRQQNRAAQRVSVTSDALGATALSIGDAFSSTARGVQEWASSLPTPMGIGMVLIAIFALLWAVIPVNGNGDTRLKLLYYTLTGRTHLHDSLVGAFETQSQQSTPGTQSPVFATSLPVEDFSTGPTTF